jgi:nanoRNase/pAp phosphatase (c-di-AMP/oligoRNAs hydrolase)
MSRRTTHLKSDRTHERLPLMADVSVSLQARPIQGSGRNISAVGVYFIADDEIRATVRIGDREVEGTLVRVEHHGAGGTGVAVRFDEGAFD